ncbi:MAG: septum formation inhibitor Maf [Gammaproteobacteria bacterium]|nr:septum formation inhibitor Maf [Gammaproteobacteria bacterium]NIR98794.1 septum formation inhibitor Maf [Gammaproteobacteria bacterium]NIT64504.1 septum formation inhibitor Maf [Gammaproteobacteria bacterium]NIV21424.1 septum formation inhibitor Maf [Gammaproteobacteria bacterium]NIX11294.1 septum formation inhibitor Maf [Gammaproteobacteria bacterium]
MLEPQLYLASRSPRRRELLRQIGVRHHVLAVDVHEQAGRGEAAEDFVTRAALDKARAGWRAGGRALDRPVLGADTAVVLDGEVLGKPRGRSHGLEMLDRLSGRRHRVLSGVALVQGRREVVRLSASEVEFRPVSERERVAYWGTGEPQDKAGAYAIQGRGAVFVAALHGSYSGVMGLPLFETSQLLGEFGIDVF